jgi:hypothetical protein
MLIRHAEEQLDAVAGVRDWPGQSAPAPPVRILLRRIESFAPTSPDDCGFRTPNGLRSPKSASGSGGRVSRRWLVLRSLKPSWPGTAV